MHSTNHNTKLCHVAFAIYIKWPYKACAPESWKNLMVSAVMFDFCLTLLSRRFDVVNFILLFETETNQAMRALALFLTDQLVNSLKSTAQSWLHVFCWLVQTSSWFVQSPYSLFNLLVSIFLRFAQVEQPCDTTTSTTMERGHENQAIQSQG